MQQRQALHRNVMSYTGNGLRETVLRETVLKHLKKVLVLSHNIPNFEQT